MICRNCANMFDDSLSSCPECGTAAIYENEKPQTENEKKSFVLNIPEEEIEKPIVITAVKSSAVDIKAEEGAKAHENKAPVRTRTRVIKTPEAGRRPVKEASKRPVRRAVKKDPIGDRSAATLIVSIMCILSCMMAVLTVVSVTSDVFKADDDVRTVALSSLSGEEAGSLEKWLVKVGGLCDSEFDCTKNTVGELFSFVKPYDSKGLYGSFFSSARLITDTPDPAQRFSDENGGYAYFRLPENEIDSIVEFCSLTVNHTVNTEECYYYDGYYYFAHVQQHEAEGSYIVDVKSGKKIQDGSYYVDCSLLQQNNLSAETKERYMIVEKASDKADEEDWIVKRISSEPIFDSNGALVKAEDEISYEMKKEIIEKKAKDGTVYHRYIIEYPIFSGEAEGVKTANQLFLDTVSTMGADDAAVQADYERFTKFGGNTTELPLVTHVISRVTYNKNGYISVLEEKAEYTPESMPPENIEELLEKGEYEPEEKTDAPAGLPVRTVEGYNFDVETGDFVTKDAIIGKQYQLISELLYRIYGGYSYDDIEEELRQTAAEAEENEQQEEGSEAQQGLTSSLAEDILQTEIPEDELGTGIKIYESASAICEKGYMFCYVTEKGYAKDIVIPFEIPNLFLIELAK